MIEDARIKQLRRLRLNCSQNIANAADPIAAIDCELEACRLINRR